MITELTLSTPNLHQTVQFYAETLGLPVSTQNGSAEFQTGASRLIFKEEKGLHPVYHFAIEIPHNQLIEAYNWMQPKAAIIPAGKDHMFSNFESWNAQSFYFRDLNGNLLEFICRYDLPNADSKEFSTDSLLYISEIGIVTDSVNKLVKNLNEQYGIGPFIKQPSLENFAALGTEEGLLIVVQNGRKWFPTEIPAKHAACHIKWKSPNGITDLYL